MKIVSLEKLDFGEETLIGITFKTFFGKIKNREIFKSKAIGNLVWYKYTDTLETVDYSLEKLIEVFLSSGVNKYVVNEEVRISYKLDL